MEPPDLVFSRLDIVQKVDLSTPLCVLEEILDAHGVRHPKGRIAQEHRQKLLDYIDELPPIRLRKPLHSKELRVMATFINAERELRWTRETLYKAFARLTWFSKPEKVDWTTIPRDFECGLQTPDHPEKFNACVLYRLCNDFGLRTDALTTLATMNQAISLLIQGPDHCFKLLAAFIRNTPPTILLDPSSCIINALVMKTTPIGDMEGEQPLDHDLLHRYITSIPYEEVASPKALAKRILPASQEEAVALAAVVYHKDISQATYPITEFRILSSCHPTYLPLDTQLRKIHILNPTLLDLTQTFNPLFSKHYYCREHLIEMALNEGYSTDTIRTNDPYELLQLSSLLENFYDGMYLEVTNEETPIALDNVNALEPGMIVCYGIRRECLTAFNIEELIDHFHTIKTFVHPIERGTTLTPRSIKKLKKIANSTSVGSEASQTAKRELLRVIEEVEFLANDALSQARTFYVLYQESSSGKKEEIRNALQRLLHLVMYMRGWGGPGQAFPIRVAPVDDQHQVDIQVTTALNRFEESCVRLEEEGAAILDLPLLKYQGKFNPSRSAASGYTIRERIDIVRQGNDTGNVASCIRLTSNVFAATAYRYIVLIGEEAPFPIKDLRRIS